jgi:cytochrome c oxidase subunit 1
MSQEKTYLNDPPGLRSWFTTTDHKRIAVLYMISITFFFAIGAFTAALFRLELLTPRGDLVSADTYNRLFSLHGIVMVWFFLIPAVPNVLGNFLIPMMIGARDLAFPRLNLLSWYLFMAGGLFTVVTALVGGVDTGWTFYAPYSSAYANSYVILAATGVFISGFSSILTGLNFLATIHTMRAPGMTWFRLPLFVWSHYATAIILVLATPSLTVVLALIAIERLCGVGIFDPKLGGDPLLFQHLFWFYSHPAVYIMIVPGMGVVSETVACFSRRPVFGYGFVAMASLAIAVLSFLVWGHHMFVSGQSMYAGVVFSFLSMMVAIPSAVKVFNWTATLYGGRIFLSTPMLYSIGFIGLFTAGGLTGVALATLGFDVHVHDTYFIVAHFHFVMVGGMVMAYLGGIHFWWPKMTGRMYPEFWGRLSASIGFFGFILTFIPLFVAGYLGNPRRYWEYAPEFQPFHIASTLGASILAVGYALPLVYLLWSLRFGQPAGDNPWRATGLEWQTASPPPPHNFRETPIVTHGPYDYDAALEVPDFGEGEPRTEPEEATAL